MYKLIKFSYWISIPIFMACLMYVYAMLPNIIGVYFSENGNIDFETDKSTLFYVSMILFIGVNFLIRLYQNMNKKHHGFDPNEFNEITREAHIYHWFSGLSLFLNLTLTLLLLFVGIYHSRDIDANQYLFLLYVGPIFLVGWFFYAFYLKFSVK